MSPTSDVVRHQLDRLLASSVFANAGRMSRFLRFVVERTLAGEGERLKEYVIGIEVFDRDTNYDPRLDSIVRVEAARLRSKLAEYYAGEGRGDTVILSLPKGGYAPIVKVEERPDAVNGAPVSNRAAANGAAASGAAAANGAAPLDTPAAARGPAPPLEPRSTRRLWLLGAVLAGGAAAAAVVAWTPSLAPVPKLRIAVLPFTPASADAAGAALAQRITEGVTAELVRDGRFRVVASSAARAEHSNERRPRDVAAALGADLLVLARITADGERIRIEARAADGHNEDKLWVETFAGDGADTDALEREIAAAVAARFSTLGPERAQ